MELFRYYAITYSDNEITMFLYRLCSYTLASGLCVKSRARGCGVVVASAVWEGGNGTRFKLGHVVTHTTYFTRRCHWMRQNPLRILLRAAKYRKADSTYLKLTGNIQWLADWSGRA
jgi:hypothetical protein